MIDLFSIKLNGNYDEIGEVPTIENGIFLCDTCGPYCKGATYQVTNYYPERIDAQKDYLIKKAIYPTILNVCEWLNNWFTLKYNYNNRFAFGGYGVTGSYHEVAQFPQTGDLCKIRYTKDWDLVSAYSFYFVSYVTVENGIVSGDNPKFKEGEQYFYYIMHLPDDVEKAISQMIYYDQFERGTVSELKSENIGNYSYTKEDVHIGSLAYPFELVAGLEACYKKVRFVQ